MVRHSKRKTRLIFIAFFFVLAVPSVVLSFQAYQQLRWQNLHQVRQVALEFAQRVDNTLRQAIVQEEARSDTDYTFFVLAGTPEARFVQRSELSKFPVNSDLQGLIGYFQIDETGNFSSPLLPSAYVQSEVVPSLYGISKEENQQRLQLEQRLKQILSDNQLVTRTMQDVVSPATQESQVASTAVKKMAKQEIGSSVSTEQIAEQLSSVAEQEQQFRLDSIQKEQRESHQKALERNQLQEKRATQKSSNDGFYKAIEQKRQQDSQKIVVTGSRIKKANDNDALTRKARTEKNYSPQQSLVDQQSNTSLLEPKDIKLKLFESEIEPFKFSQLESGHFVIYRQVWRNNKRVVQGALIASKAFISQYFAQAFNQSSLIESTQLSLFFGEQLLQSWHGRTSDYSASRATTLEGEALTQVNLSEPFSQFSLDFKVINMPVAAGAGFVSLVASCLIFGLVLGTFLLYRLALKQSFLVQQQQDFVSSVSHELKTPLTSIRMYGEILKQGWVSEDKKLEYYDYIYSESERLSRLIANVLQISGVNHNALELKLETVKAAELANLVRSKIDSQIEQSGFELNMRLDEHLSESSVVVDRDAFIQVMINLVDNAIKYAGGTKRQQIDIRFQIESNSILRISVRDYGPGISKQHMKRIFDLFYRSGDEMTREVKGTGIGLALVKELVKAMSSQISVKNRHPGVDFRIDIPLV
jgi:signal transduction histidine kinase